ncbi:hypothetical protein HY213_02790 [Candidatus Peregrinibacteria bacterium]|nr:hypothetical protein [Candidatus Peregrinibacteria bacterium]
MSLSPGLIVVRLSVLDIVKVGGGQMTVVVTVLLWLLPGLGSIVEEDTVARF